VQRRGGAIVAAVLLATGVVMPLPDGAAMAGWPGLVVGRGGSRRRSR
jgi:hypothetical protein